MKCIPLRRFDIDSQFNGEYIELVQRNETDGKYVEWEDVVKFIKDLCENATAPERLSEMSADVKVHRNDMSVDIYRVVDKSGSSFIHNEVCRDCAVNFRKKGFNIEFDDHLSKFIYIVDGMTFYADGSDDEDEEITCSICGEPLVSGLSQLSSDVKEN